MKMAMQLRKLAAAVAAVTMLAIAPAHANDASTRASGDLSLASAAIVGGSVLLTSGAGELVVQSVEASGDAVTVVARGVSDASELVLRMSADLAGTLSLATGSVVTAVAHSAGTLLVHAGKAVAFLPNELGRELLHRRRVGEAL
ncbi:MAG: hypothetical protein KIT13_03885 [Burkholderiales bacterium]|nr:hypothetical protein [Burkholderiales bacterium]MCW5575215.1 hypothetical protein [Burkholderiales bacterium]